MIKEVPITYSSRKFKAVFKIARHLLLFRGWLIHFTFSNLLIYDTSYYYLSRPWFYKKEILGALCPKTHTHLTFLACLVRVSPNFQRTRSSLRQSQEFLNIKTNSQHKMEGLSIVNGVPILLLMFITGRSEKWHNHIMVYTSRLGQDYIKNWMFGNIKYV